MGQAKSMPEAQRAPTSYGQCVSGTAAYEHRGPTANLLSANGAYQQRYLGGTMRILRGLFRLWVVASVIWMLSVGVMTWLTWPVEPKASSETVVLENGYAKPPFDPSKPFTDVATGQMWANARALFEAERRDAVVKGASIAIAPPLVVFILGMALLWVVRGFRTRP